jgi:hypothetical protein
MSNYYHQFCFPYLRSSLISRPVSRSNDEEISQAWWLLPIFFMWIGGIIAWVALRERIENKAKQLLIWGFIFTAFWVFIAIISSGIGSCAH